MTCPFFVPASVTSAFEAVQTGEWTKENFEYWLSILTDNAYEAGRRSAFDEAFNFQ